MSKKLTNKNFIIGKLKRLFVEQVWVILLFTPLIIIGLLVGKHYLPNAQPTIITSTKNRSVSSIEMQVTSAELSAIVAKPLNKLLSVEVYYDGVDEIINKTKALDDKSNKVLSNVVLISLYDDMLITQVPLVVLPKENNNKKGELS